MELIGNADLVCFVLFSEDFSLTGLGEETSAAETNHRSFDFALRASLRMTLLLSSQGKFRSQGN